MKFDKLVNLYLETVAGSFEGSHNQGMQNKITAGEMSELVDGALIDVDEDITLDDMYRMYGDEGISKEIIDILWKGVLKIRKSGGINNPYEYPDVRSEEGICDGVMDELEAKGFVK
jgi:hypothetical protein